MTARPGIARVPAPLPAAHCEIDVEGIGVIDLEEDYLPHVIQCENGGANLEALKAQAIAARSVAYYAIETAGSICNSQGCQVYSCNGTPDPIHYQAVQETSGRYLLYNETLTYGFYVAGDNAVVPPECKGDPNAGTEQWVTYNEGKSGTEVSQTALGYVHDPAEPGYGQNRGCMSQWGARCLENDVGYTLDSILRFYYGDDIVIAQAMGECVIGGTSSEGTSSEGDPSRGGTGGVSSSGSPPPESSSAGAGPTTTGGGTSSGGIGSGLPESFGASGGSDDGCGCRAGWGPCGALWSGVVLLGLAFGRRRERAPK